MKKWTRLRNESAVTEVIGTMLLLVIAVTLFSVVYFAVLTQPATPATPSANIACRVSDDGEIIFEHCGGSPLAADSRILIKIDDESSEEFISFKIDDTWSVGEKINFTNYLILGKEIEVNVIDSQTNSIVMIGRLFVPDKNFTLIIHTSGNGYVVKYPDEIDYSYGTDVTLEAFPDTDWDFIGWDGDLFGSSNPETITITRNSVVRAIFKEVFSLTLTTSGTGTGSIEASPSGPYYYGAEVTIWANASVGSAFTGFSGELTGAGSPQVFTIDGHNNVDAEFTLGGPFELTLTTSGTGTGSIEASPSGPYYYGAEVTIWANASVGSTFTTFDGDLTEMTSPQTIVMDGDKSVDAEFTLDGPFELTLTTSGTGTGSIEASPSGPYYYGAEVTIWANASIGSLFTGFDGDITGTTTPQTIFIDADKSVDAQFNLIYTLSLTTSGTGSGTMEASPSGPYTTGTLVTIWANASVCSSFTGFSGELSGATTPQTITMDEDKTVDAQFTQLGPYTLTLTTSGTGSGTIEASPSGPYYCGDVVTIWANASTGSSFTGFSGDLTGTTTPQTITIDSDKTINSNFNIQEMHVFSIAMSSETQNPGWFGNERRGIATVTIVDAYNNVVSDATVEGVWSGLATNSESGTTNNEGVVTLYSSWRWLSWLQSGTFTFTVTDVTKTGWVYNASANVVTSGSVTV